VPMETPTLPPELAPAALWEELIQIRATVERIEQALTTHTGAAVNRQQELASLIAEQAADAITQVRVDTTQIAELTRDIAATVQPRAPSIPVDLAPIIAARSVAHEAEHQALALICGARG
jgi:hypothetical protein